MGIKEKIVAREMAKKGYKGKVRAFCCHCIYDPHAEGTWLEQIDRCTSDHCPLYSVRPRPRLPQCHAGDII